MRYVGLITNGSTESFIGRYSVDGPLECVPKPLAYTYESEGEAWQAIDAWIDSGAAMFTDAVPATLDATGEVTPVA